MPVSEMIDHNNRLVITTATGVLQKSDFITHIENTWCDESISGYDEILDATTADASQLTAQDLSDIVKSGVVYDPNSKPRLALCVNSELAYGIGRMFGSMRENHEQNSREIQVFRDLEAAREWLKSPRE